MSCAAAPALLAEFTTRLEQVAAREGVTLIGHPLDAGHPEVSRFFLDPVHPTADGNALIAEKVTAYLAQAVFAGSAPRTPGS